MVKNFGVIIVLSGSEEFLVFLVTPCGSLWLFVAFGGSFFKGFDDSLWFLMVLSFSWFFLVVLGVFL